MCNKTGHQHDTKSGKAKSIFPKMGNEMSIYLFSQFFFNLVRGQRDKSRQRHNTDADSNGRVKPSLFIDDMVLFLKALTLPERS